MGDGCYITAGGKRWHSDGDCQALIKGQDDAAGRGLSTHPVRRVPRSLVDGRTPCGWCVMDDQQDDIPTVRLEHLRSDTRWEQVFRDCVLAALPELAPWTIASQQDVTVAGRTYRPDFTLTKGALRVLVEIDGADKGPNGPSHDYWTRRQTALVSDGWEVLRFTNDQVMHDQENCRRVLTSTVARLQERARLAAVPAVPARPLPGVLPPAQQAAPQPASHPFPSRRRLPWMLLGAASVVGVGLLLSSGAHVIPAPEGVQAGARTSGSATPQDDGRNVGFLVCPTSHPIRGNVTQQGQRIYHQPNDRFYSRTRPEVCFATNTAASAAGYRPAAR